MVHPLAARSYVTKALLAGVDNWLAEQGFDVRVLNRVYPGRAGLKKDEGDEEETPGLIPGGFPYIVVSGGDVKHNHWADEITLARETVLVRWVMSSQALPDGVDVEEYVAAIDGAIQATLTDVLFPSPVGTVHGCKLVRPYRPPVYGDDEEAICEMGWFVEITSN